MAKNRLTAKTPHYVRRTVRRLHAVFYHIFLRKKSLMRRCFRRCLLLFQNFSLFWVYPGNPFSGNVLPNSPTHNHLLPLCGGGKKEERLCSEWEAAYSSGKGANEVQRLWKTNAIALNAQLVTNPVFHTTLAWNLLAAFQSGRNSFCLEFLVLFVQAKRTINNNMTVKKIWKCEV